MTIIVKTIKRIATGLLVAGFAVTVAAAANTEKAAELMWYTKDASGWVEHGLSEAPPSGCQETFGEICAKGFNPENVPTEIDDSTPAENRYREL